MTRNFQLGAMVICVAAITSVYLNTRDHRELDDGNRVGADTLAATLPPTPSLTAGPAFPSPPSSPTRPAPTFPADQPPVPKSAAEILAELRRRGLTLNEVKPGGTTMYAVKGAPLGIGFRERNGKLFLVEAMALTGMADKHPTELRGWVATVGEVSTDLPRGGVLQVFDLLLADVGNFPCGFNRTVDNGKERFKIDVTRHDDGAYSITFYMEKPEPGK